MLFLISPAKTLDYDSRIAAATERAATEPAFMDRAAALIALLKPQTPAQIASLMDLSDDLAALNVGRYAAWQPHNTAANSRPAALAFNGDVYEGTFVNGEREGRGGETRTGVPCRPVHPSAFPRLAQRLHPRRPPSAC